MRFSRLALNCVSRTLLPSTLLLGSIASPLCSQVPQSVSLSVGWTAVAVENHPNWYGGLPNYQATMFTPGVSAGSTSGYSFSGPILRLQAGNNFYTSAFHPVINVTGLSTIPSDAKILTATLTLTTAEQFGGSGNVDAEVYGLTKTLSPIGSDSAKPTWNNLADYRHYPLSGPSQITPPYGEDVYGNRYQKSFDISNIIRCWVQDRPACTTLVVRDKAEDDTSQQTNEHYVDFSSVPADISITVTYTTTSSINPTGGWPTLQGNPSRTGRVGFGVRNNATSTWQVQLPSLPRSPKTGANRVYDVPGIVAARAVGDSSNLGVIFTAQTEGMMTRIFRVDEHLGNPANGNKVWASVTQYVDIPDFQITGTPLLVNGNIYLVGNKPSSTTTGDNNAVYIYALDGLTLQPLKGWTRVFRPLLPNDGFWMGSFAYASPVSAMIEGRECIIVALSLSYLSDPVNPDATSSNGFLVALDAATGRNVWGRTYPNGDLMPYQPYYNGGSSPAGYTPGGLMPLEGHPGKGAPTVDLDHQIVYVSGGQSINARSLALGAKVWSLDVGASTGTLAYANNKLYGMHNGEAFCITGIETSSSQLKRWSVFQDTTFVAPEYRAPFQGCNTPALYDSGNAAIFATPTHIGYPYPPQDGLIMGIKMDGSYTIDYLGQFIGVSQWPKALRVSNHIYSPPLVAGSIGSQNGNCFIATDGGLIHTVNAGSGPPDFTYPATTLHNGNPLDGGSIRAPLAMLPWRTSYPAVGRLYAVTTGYYPDYPWMDSDLVAPAPPTLYCFE